MKRRPNKPVFIVPLSWCERNALWPCLDFLYFLKPSIFQKINIKCIDPICKILFEKQSSDDTASIKMTAEQYCVCLDAVNAAVQYLDGINSLFVDLDNHFCLRLISELKNRDPAIRNIRNRFKQEIIFYQSEGYVFPAQAVL